MYLCPILEANPMITGTREEAKKNKEKCLRILAISSNIRFVGKINDFGRTLAGQLRKDVVPLFKPDEARNENFVEATRNHLRKAFESSIGKTTYTLTENEKVKVLSVPRETFFYYITLDKNTEVDELYEIINSVLDITKEE
jgi:hypothetical protein